MTEIQELSARLAEYKDNPHHINPVSERFKSLLDDILAHLRIRAETAKNSGEVVEEPVAWRWYYLSWHVTIDKATAADAARSVKVEPLYATPANSRAEQVMVDTRPHNCRFRLRDEGKAYPRSSCRACGKTIMTGLGENCTRIQPTTNTTNDSLCGDCPRIGYPTDETRCTPCPRRHTPANSRAEQTQGEPVGWRYWDEVEQSWLLCGTDPTEFCDEKEGFSNPQPLYTHPTTARADAIRECIAVAERTSSRPFSETRKWHGDRPEAIIDALRALLDKEDGK